MKKKYHSLEEFASDLLLYYPDHYETVAFGFIVEAVETAIIELNGNIKSLDELHNYIVENLI